VRRTVLALLVPFALWSAPSGVAQPLPPQLFPRIEMVGSAGAPLPDGWWMDRVPGPLDELRFAVTLTNESRVAFVIDQALFRGVFTARLVNPAGSVTMQWRDPVGAFIKVPVSQSTPDHVQIDPGRSATWTMVIRRSDRQKFIAGEYRLMLMMGNLRPVVSSPGGGTWGGRPAEQGLWLRAVSVNAG
jgi:hypothetical protein